MFDYTPSSTHPGKKRRPVCFYPVKTSAHRIAAALMFSLMLCAGCATQHTTVVLLPDTDGKVGKVAVATPQGTLQLDQAGQSTTLRHQAPPSAPDIMDEGTISNRFSPVLAVEPAQPEQFILYFQAGSDILAPESLALIPEIAEKIKHRRSMDIGVAGHSDRVGNESNNIALSLKRAQRVSALLVENGVEKRVIHTSSHGEGNPLIPTPDDVPEPRNRRVEVTVR